MTPGRNRGPGLLLALALGCAPAAADRLHLENGGTIDVASWWVEGDWLHYESPAGTIAVPRSLVLRVEKTGEGPPAPPAVLPPTAPTPPAASARLTGEQRREIEALLLEARDALEKRDFERAGEACRRVIRLDDHHNGARVGYAISEMSLGRDALALGAVLDGLALEPDHAELSELLGDLRNREERVEDALRAWRAAFASAPTDRVREKILKAERELQAGGNYDLAATSHFNVRFDGDVDATLADAVMDYLEEQYWTLSERYRHAPPQPIAVLLYPTREFRDVTRSPEWVGGLYDGKIRVPLGGLRRLDPRARAVLSHELTHAVVHSKTRGHCPRWLHEGLAQISEGRELNDADAAVVRRILTDNAPAQWEAAGFSYPAALSLVRFIEQRRDFAALVWMLDLLAEGQEIDDALRRVYGADYAGLCKQWASEMLGARRR